MVKSGLVQRIVLRNPHLSESECRKLVDAFFDAMIGHLSQDGFIELRGFGSFLVRRHANRVVRDPQSGAVTTKDQIASVRFRPGQPLATSINRS